MTDEEVIEEQEDLQPIDLSDEFELLLSRLVNGAREDVRAMAEQLAVDASEAALLGRMDLADEIAAQVRALGEKHRLNAVGTGWKVLQTVIRTVVRALVLKI